MLLWDAAHDIAAAERIVDGAWAYAAQVRARRQLDRCALHELADELADETRCRAAALVELQHPSAAGADEDSTGRIL